MRGILYAALEIVTFLLIATAIGFALGWYVVSRIRRSRGDHAVVALEAERDGLKIELDRAWARVDEAKQRLEVAYEKLDQLTEPRATVAPVSAAVEPVEAVQPAGSLDFVPAEVPSLVDVLPAAAPAPPAPANGDGPAIVESETERIARLEARLAEQAAIMERLADRMSELQD